MKVGIAIDSWKLKVFKKHLDSNGFAFSHGRGLTDNTLSLYVVTDRIDALVEAAQSECRRSKMN